MDTRVWMAESPLAVHIVNYLYTPIQNVFGVKKN